MKQTIIIADVKKIPVEKHEIEIDFKNFPDKFSFGNSIFIMGTEYTVIKVEDK